MAGVHAGRGGTCVLAALGLLLIAVPRAAAVEAFDGRIQAHGFLEMQIRGLDRDFEEEFDLAQWYNVVNVELEFDILPDGWGPFDLLQAYVRLEGRFDCLYYDACGIFPSARTYGNKSRNLPLRLRDAFDEDYAGVIESNDKATPPGNLYRVPEDTREPTGWVVPQITTLNNAGDGRFDNIEVKRIGPAGDYPAGVILNTLYEPGIDYDPFLDNSEAPFNEDDSVVRPPQYARWEGPNPSVIGPDNDRAYCPTNGRTGTLDEPIPIGCYTNRPQVFELEKRRGFPGFDTVFDIKGADGELGPNPDYSFPDVRNENFPLAQPEATVNQLRALPGGSLGVDPDDPSDDTPAPDATVQAYERALRGLALERDDPAYYTFGVKVDTSIIDKVDVSAIPPEDLTQEAARAIVYGEGGDPNNPDCVGGYCEEIREAGLLYTIDPIFDWEFTFRDKVGPAGGTGQTLILGPWLPKNFFGNLAAASDRANPFRGRETPTFIQRPDNVSGPATRYEGQRYHILDVAGGVFNPTTDCDTGVCTYGADPIDPRLLKYEQILIAAGANNVSIGGHAPGGGYLNPNPPPDYLTPQPKWFGPYPNRHMSEVNAFGNFIGSFGGDFSGIVPRYNTYTSRPSFGSALKGDVNFIQQISVPGTPGYISSSFETTIAYTNIHVTGGLGELPMRPAPDASNLSKLDPMRAQGLYIPSRGMVSALQNVDFDDHEFNISQIDRAFNHGASQSDTYEVKEAYLDMEFLDSRLWLRAGIQNIVWGKTELFRTTDQFNPQDLAMASLPGLEESRIALLSARAVYSFYDIGPLEDVRLELAANFDRIKPADLGACGEPYTFDVVCGASFGLAIHSMAGIGLAGVDRPPSGWNDLKGIEFGGRVEFRWDRFSFAITDFYGYDDLPYPDPIFFYERNVDPNTGRPRKAGATGPCENAAAYTAYVNFADRIIHAGNSRLEFVEGDDSAAPSGTESKLTWQDDYARRAESYSILGVGIDEACLKPGGAPRYPNENRFDDRPDDPSFVFSSLPPGADKCPTSGPGFDPDDPDCACTLGHPMYDPNNAECFWSPTHPMYDPENPNWFPNFPEDGTYPDPDDYAAYSGVNDRVDPDSYIYQTLGQWSLDGSSVDYALAFHPANQQFFAALCSATITVAVSLTPGACGFNIFGSPSQLVPLQGAGPIVPFSEYFAVLTAGEINGPDVMTGGWRLIQQNTKANTVTKALSAIPTSPMNRDVRDGMVTATAPWVVRGGDPYWVPGDPIEDKPSPWHPENFLSLDSTLTMEQKALLGCGPFFGTRCDSGKAGNAVGVAAWQWGEGGGVDVLNAEASAVLQAFPGIEGTDTTSDNSNYACHVRILDPDALGVGPDAIERAEDSIVVDCDDPSFPRAIDIPMLEGLGDDVEVGIKRTSVPRVVKGLGKYVGSSDSDDYLLDTWVTWSDDIQPGTVAPYTIGPDDLLAPGRSFEGMEHCTRYAPDSPYADERGIVRLPGCRGAESVRLNHEPNFSHPTLGLLPTVDVVFEEHYTPKQDGCIFRRFMTARDGTRYYVQAVNEDGSRNAALNTELLQTCWNTNANQISLISTHRWTAELDPRDPVDYPDDEAEITNTWPYIGSPESVLGARTLFHPMAGCENALLDQKGNRPWLESDVGYLCDFRFRDLDADFIEGHAQVFRNEVANWSWNMLLFLTVTSCNNQSGGDDLNDSDCFNPDLAWDVTRCSLSTPQFCRNVKSFLAIGATNRNHVLAGGSDRFGRRDFIWHSGGEAVLSYAQRNVFGFSMDFAEDVSKTNWGLEFTWFGDRPFLNNNSWNAISDSQTLNLTISVDRPTFINFLNANRTFFFNTQWFFQYLLDYDDGFTGTTGPFNVLFTFAFFTGYFQDRLLPQMVTVYDFRSQSGGFLPSIQYRFNERFSVTFGVSWWIGRGQYIPMPVRSLAPVTNRAGPHAYEDGAEFLISNFRHRDEAYLRIRWTF